ncbi:Carbon storage regulator [bacterium HR36]|nr:Carbon storage regulator [bacterium HR36]
MLVLTRKSGEKLVIGHEIEVTVLEVRGKHVKIGIQAPDSVKIVRAELRQSHPDSYDEAEANETSIPEESWCRRPMAVS